MSQLILPDSRLASNAWTSAPKGARWGIFGWEVPTHCYNCGCKGPYTPQEGMTSFSWLCDSCFAKWGEQTAFYVLPDEVYYLAVYEAQLAEYGRALTYEESVDSLSDPNSLESTLARDRAALTPKAA